MSSRSDDFETFGIDPADPDATDQLRVAHYLVGRGTSIDDIRSASGLNDLTLRMWSHLLVGTDERISLAEAARRADMTEDAAERIIRLLGFPNVGVTGIAPPDVEMLRFLAGFESIVGAEVFQQIARVVGSSMGRVAESLTAPVRVTYEAPLQSNDAYVEYVELVGMMMNDYYPHLIEAMDRIIRYYLYSFGTQSWAVDAEASAMMITRAVGFADMVGFTTRAGALSTRELTLMIDGFESQVSDAIAGRGGRAVKFIGDEVFFAFDDPSAACACALDLLGLAGGEIPEVRVGMTYGQVIARFGDYYGPVVNLASRLVDIADAGTALVSTELVARAPDFSFETMPARTVKGVAEPVTYVKLTS